MSTDKFKLTSISFSKKKLAIFQHLTKVGRDESKISVVVSKESDKLLKCTPNSLQSPLAEIWRWVGCVILVL